MTKIEQLQQQVQEIEESVNPDWEPAELYEVLVVAYNHLKDIIVLQQDLVPVKEDKASEAALQDAKDELADAIGKHGRLETKLSEADAKVLELEHWKNGANLEGEQMRDEIESLTARAITENKLFVMLKTGLEELLENAK